MRRTTRHMTAMGSAFALMLLTSACAGTADNAAISGRDTFTVCAANSSGDEGTDLSRAVQQVAETQGVSYASASGHEAGEELLRGGCSLIVGSSSFTESFTSLAQDNPSVNFALLTSPTEIEQNLAGAKNITTVDIRVGEATYLAGYAAAGMTTTGSVTTLASDSEAYTVSAMDGFAQGVDAYNREHGTSISVADWDAASRSAVVSQDEEKARDIVSRFIASGTDIVMPLGEAATRGTVDAIRQANNPLIRLIWHTTDRSELAASASANSRNNTEKMAGGSQSGEQPQSDASAQSAESDRSAKGSQFTENLSDETVKGLGVSVLTGVFADIESVVERVVTDALRGDVNSDGYIADMKSHEVALTGFGTYSSFLSEELVQGLNRLNNDIMSGDLRVSSGGTAENR